MSEGPVPQVHGVDTSIAAFLGRARRGPVNRPVEIGGMAELADRFGGLWEESPLGFAVREFFRNGGRRAVVVRLFAPGGAASVRSRLAVGGLELAAADEGSWGDGLRVAVEHPDPADPSTRRAADELGVDPGDLFDLRVRDPLSGGEEMHRYLTVAPGPRRVDAVLTASSRLVRTRGGRALPDARPAVGDYGGATGGSDGAPLDESAYLEPAAPLPRSDRRAPYVGSRVRRQGIHALDRADLVNVVVLPPPAFGQDLPPAVWSAAAAWAEERRAMLLVDPPRAWASAADVRAGLPTLAAALGTGRNAVLTFPAIEAADVPRPGERSVVAPSGAVAGIWARTDAAAGVWKSPAGVETQLRGDPRPAVRLTREETEDLNRRGVIPLRELPGDALVVWGARTVAAVDPEWRFLAVRRLALFIEESLGRGTRWAVFEPNAEPLWARLRAAAATFLHGLFRQGALQGAKPADAYAVRCDATTTTQADLDRGVVVVRVWFAPFRPVEFHALTIRQATRRDPPD